MEEHGRFNRSYDIASLIQGKSVTTAAGPNVQDATTRNWKMGENTTLHVFEPQASVSLAKPSCVVIIELYGRL